MCGCASGFPELCRNALLSEAHVIRCDGACPKPGEPISGWERVEIFLTTPSRHPELRAGVLLNSPDPVESKKSVPLGPESN